MEEKLTKEQELTEAQKFLIKKAREYPPFTTHGLNQLPYALMPAVAKCMDEFVQLSLNKDHPTTASASAAAPKETIGKYQYDVLNEAFQSANATCTKFWKMIEQLKEENERFKLLLEKSTATVTGKQSNDSQHNQLP